MDELADLNLKKSLIKQQACFTQLTDQEITELSDLLKPVTAEAGETLVTEGDSVDSVYFIIKGTAHVGHMTIKDRVAKFTAVATLNPGDSIGLNETGFYSVSGRRTATVVAIESMQLFRLSTAEFHGFALARTHVSSVMRENASTFSNTK